LVKDTRKNKLSFGDILKSCEQLFEEFNYLFTILLLKLMKMKTYTILSIALFTLLACTKDATPVTVPVKFTSTTYETLGTWDTSGKPNYLLTMDTISAGVQATIKNTLAEQSDLRTTHPELLNNPAIADITITQPSDVFITFVSQGATFANTFAFYTYSTDNPPASEKDIKTITYIFPNVGRGTKLKAGDKVKLGRFDVGTSIGFVLMQDAWDRTLHTLDTDVVHFCSNDVLNPEVDPNLKKHAVLISYSPESKVLIGFEDTDRTTSRCDNDFNDIVTYATIVH
jgi:hypothetical protein